MIVEFNLQEEVFSLGYWLWDHIIEISAYSFVLLCLLVIKNEWNK